MNQIQYGLCIRCGSHCSLWNRAMSKVVHAGVHARNQTYPSATTKCRHRPTLRADLSFAFYRSTMCNQYMLCSIIVHAQLKRIFSAAKNTTRGPCVACFFCDTLLTYILTSKGRSIFGEWGSPLLTYGVVWRCSVIKHDAASVSDHLAAGPITGQLSVTAR